MDQWKSLMLFTQKGVRAITVVMIVITNVSFATCSLQAEENSVAKRICLEKDYHNTIHWLWEKRKPVYVKWLKDSLHTPYNLYNVQGETNNLLKYAGLVQDTRLIEELNLLYSLSIDTLKETDQYSFYYYPGSPRQSVHKLGSKHKMWLTDGDPVGVESTLVSSQFLYLLSESASIVSLLPPEKRSPALQKTIRQFILVLLDHYERWIFSQPGPFQVRGWGCKKNGTYVPTGMNHFDFLMKKRERSLGDCYSPLYCNAVTDTDMWIVAGVVNLLAAHKYDDNLVQIPKELVDKLMRYARLGVGLLHDRFFYTTLKNFSGETVTGALFEPGAWDDHNDRAYSGYSGENFPVLPTPERKKRGKGLGWDLSHAKRFVHVFGALYLHHEALNLNFPSEDFMKKLSNQFVYASFNRDFNRPLFSNFMDGSDGWFRVGYEERPGFGYGPWDMSIAALTGGYGFWSVYNPDVKAVYQALLKMICSSDPQERMHLQDNYEKDHWYKYSKTNQRDFSKMENAGCQSVLIQFLPSFPVM